MFQRYCHDIFLLKCIPLCPKPPAKIFCVFHDAKDLPLQNKALEVTINTSYLYPCLSKDLKCWVRKKGHESKV